MQCSGGVGASLERRLSICTILSIAERNAPPVSLMAMITQHLSASFASAQHTEYRMCRVPAQSAAWKDMWDDVVRFSTYCGHIKEAHCSVMS